MYSVVESVAVAQYEQYYPGFLVRGLWFFERARPFPRSQTITRSAQSACTVRASMAHVSGFQSRLRSL